MKQVRVFKNHESREVIRQWYQKFTDVLPFPVREQTVQTRFGSTLDLPRVVLAGVSWGGSVAMQMAKHKPERIAGMILVVPGSIIRGSAWRGCIDVGLPMLRFKCWPTDANRDKALNKVVTSHDPMWTPYLADAFAHYRTDFQVPPVVRESDMARLQSPVFVFAADKDVFFPGPALLNQAKKVFPNLVGTHLFSDSYHSPSFTAEARRAFTEVFEQAVILVSPHECVSPTEAR